jgi:hypothetical protein
MTQSNSQTVTIQIEGVEVEGIKVAKACITLTGQVTDASLYQRFSFAKWALSAVGPFYKKVIENFLDMGDKEPNDLDTANEEMAKAFRPDVEKWATASASTQAFVDKHDDACECAICSIERVEKEELS